MAMQIRIIFKGSGGQSNITIPVADPSKFNFAIYAGSIALNGYYCDNQHVFVPYHAIESILYFDPDLHTQPPGPAPIVPTHNEGGHA